MLEIAGHTALYSFCLILNLIAIYLIKRLDQRLQRDYCYDTPRAYRGGTIHALAKYSRSIV